MKIYHEIREKMDILRKENWDIKNLTSYYEDKGCAPKDKKTLEAWMNNTVSTKPVAVAP